MSQCLGRLFLFVVISLVGSGAAGAFGPASSYYVYVASESDDEVAVVRYGPGGAELVKRIAVGRYPTEIEGPHGLNIGPDGKYWYVSIAHGFPYGSVHKYQTGTDEWVGEAEVGLFPATLDLSPSTGLLYVVNFNLHGPLEPSTISIVEVETMTEVAQVPSGIRPHGGRFGRDGRYFYSVNMMGFELVELDALNFDVTRRLALGEEVMPTWVATSAVSGKAYVAGSNVAKVFEIDLDTWVIDRTFEVGPGPYNLAVSPDGTNLVITYKTGQAVGFLDLESGKEIERTKTSRAIPHGVVVTPDGEYAFVTLEGIGDDPGTVEIYSMATGERVGAVDVGQQAGGIAFWKILGC